MPYWSEFRSGRRPLLAAAIGMGFGMSATNIIVSIMAPHFLKDFGWTPAAFARVGAVSILMSAFIPVAGRLADVWGVRRTATIGIVALPLCMFALSRMTGDIIQYYVMFILQAAFCVTTTATVYSRVVVVYFQRARGLALAIAASAPSISGIFAGLILNPFVDAHGWRAGYVAMAIVLTVTGVITWLLLSGQRRTAPTAETGGAVVAQPPAKRRWADYPAIFRTRAFWILIVGMVLCNLHQTLALTQINLLVLSKGIDRASVGGIISAFSAAMLVGRFACGFAIDRLPGRIVAAVGMGLPSVGLFLLASQAHSLQSVTAAMIFIGAAFGAEGDLIGVLVARAFGTAIYGSVMGLVTGMISLATASGALLLSLLLQHYGGYSMFLLICGTSVLIGSATLLLLPRAAAAPAIVPSGAVQS